MSAERRLYRDQLTHERLLEVLHYDPDTGVFTWKVAVGSKIKAGKTAGSLTSNGYICIGIDCTHYQVHRLAWFYVKQAWPNNQIDHINGVRGDNRLVNLRDVNNSENAQNTRNPRSSNNSGFLGVNIFKRDKTFQAQITVNGKKKHLGYFTTATVAHEAYLTAKRELHPFCTI